MRMNSLIKLIKNYAVGIYLKVYYFIGERQFRWDDTTITGVAIKKKKYKSYDQYVKHQGSKLEKIKGVFFDEYDKKYHQALLERLRDANVVKSGSTVLCLAARIGTEVKSFLDLGCFAIGIDLNPGDNNRYVLHGDFHALQFTDHTVDVIFCNSIDHAYDYDKLISEIKRVLKPNGILILEISKGEQEGRHAGLYEVFSWEKTEDVVAIFLKHNMVKVYQSEFDYPWLGYHICLKAN